MINKHVLWRLYEIRYEVPRGDLPTEIHVDLNDHERFPWMKDVEIGMMHLNFKAFRAIKEITGSVAIGCKVEMIKK
jgi:hypothetical protein